MKTKKEKKRAGKPTLYKKAMKRHNVHLSDEHVKIAIALSGEISAGIRLALETVAKERGLTPLAPDSSKAGVLSLPESVKVENVLPAESG